MSTITAPAPSASIDTNRLSLRRAPSILDLDEDTLVRIVPLGRGPQGEYVYAELRVRHNVSRGRIVATLSRRLRQADAVRFSQPVIDGDYASTRLAEAHVSKGTMREQLNAALGTAIRALLAPEAEPFLETIMAPAHHGDRWQAGVAAEAR